MITNKVQFQNSQGEYLNDALQPIANKNQGYVQHSSTRYINVHSAATAEAPLNYSQKELPELYRQKMDCCGCAACYAVCPMSGNNRPENARRGTDGKIGSNGILQIDFLTSGYSRKTEVREHTGAISMLPDEEGFLYPVVDAEICIRCHLCEQVCTYPRKTGER